MKTEIKIKGFGGVELLLKPHLHLKDVTDFMGNKHHNIGLSFTHEEDGVDEPYAVFTLNLGEYIGIKNCAYVDTNNCWFSDDILHAGIAKNTGLTKLSGMYQYPLWSFDEDFLKSVDADVYQKYSDEFDKYMQGVAVNDEE